MGRVSGTGCRILGTSLLSPYTPHFTLPNSPPSHQKPGWMMLSTCVPSHTSCSCHSPAPPEVVLGGMEIMEVRGHGGLWTWRLRRGRGRRRREGTTHVRPLRETLTVLACRFHGTQGPSEAAGTPMQGTVEGQTVGTFPSSNTGQTCTSFLREGPIAVLQCRLYLHCQQCRPSPCCAVV